MRCWWPATSNPGAEAQATWYRFVTQARIRCPKLDLVVIGGNHDLTARLDAPDPLFAALDVRVVGGLPRYDEHRICIEV